LSYWPFYEQTTSMCPKPIQVASPDSIWSCLKNTFIFRLIAWQWQFAYLQIFNTYFWTKSFKIATFELLNCVSACKTSCEEGFYMTRQCSANQNVVCKRKFKPSPIEQQSLANNVEWPLWLRIEKKSMPTVLTEI